MRKDEFGLAGSRDRFHTIGASAMAAMLLSAAVAAATPEPFWPTRHRDLRNSDFVPLAGPRTVVPTWYALGVPPATFAGVGGDGVLVTNTMNPDDLPPGPYQGCRLWALDPADGTIRWCSAEPRPTFTSIALGPDGAVFIADGTELFRFESGGALAWRRPIATRVSALTFLPQGFLLIADFAGLFTVHDPATGDLVADPFQLPGAPNPPGVVNPAFLPGLAAIGVDPAFTLTLAEDFFGFGAVVKDEVAVHPTTGRIYWPANNEAGDGGQLWALSFRPPSDGTPGRIEVACTAPMGPGSDTSPAISTDLRHVYASDGGGALFAFDADDCGVAWSVPVTGSAPASPSVDLEGRVFALSGTTLVAFRDEGGSGTVLWEVDITPLAQAAGFPAARFDSVLPATPNYLYATSSWGIQIPGLLVPQVQRLVTIDVETGVIVALVDLGEECDSTPSLGRHGQVYVPAKPLSKGAALGLRLAGILPPTFPIPDPAPGLYAFEPASYAELAGDGLDVADGFLATAAAALEQGHDARLEQHLAWAAEQLEVVAENVEIAAERSEVAAKTVRRVAHDARQAAKFARLAAALAGRPWDWNTPVRVLIGLAGYRIDKARRALHG